MFDLAEADRLETQHPDAMACAVIGLGMLRGYYGSWDVQ